MGKIGMFENYPMGEKCPMACFAVNDAIYRSKAGVPKLGRRVPLGSFERIFTTDRLSNIIAKSFENAIVLFINYSLFFQIRIEGGADR